MSRTFVVTFLAIALTGHAVQGQEKAEKIAEAIQARAAAAARSVVDKLPPAATGPGVRLDILIARVAFDADGKLRLSDQEAEPIRVGMLGASLATRLNEERKDFSEDLTPGTAGANLLLEKLAGAERLEALERIQLVLTADGKQVRLQDGHRVPRVVGSQSSPGRGMTSAVQLENLGTLVSGSARISDGGNVALAIAVERSSFGPEEEGTPVATSEDGAIRSPRIDTMTAETQVVLGDGETAVLSSLVRSWSDKLTETFVLVTPTIVAP